MKICQRLKWMAPYRFPRAKHFLPCRIGSWCCRDGRCRGGSSNLHFGTARVLAILVSGSDLVGGTLLGKQSKKNPLSASNAGWKWSTNLQGRQQLPKIGWASSNAARHSCIRRITFLQKPGWAIAHSAHPLLTPLD